MLDVLRHVEDKRPFVGLELAERISKAVIDLVGVIDFHGRPGYGMLVDPARTPAIDAAERRQANLWRWCSPDLASWRKDRSCGEARIAIRHADGGGLMMGMNIFEPLLLTQLHNDVLVGIAHDRKNVINVFSRNGDGERLQYLQDDLHSILKE